jgi:class 3 adenylate cyclase/predicted ATPase
VHCGACGAENAPGNRFCNRCGTALATLCGVCGQPNPPDAGFCGSCGNAVGAQPATADAPAPTAATQAAASGAERRLVTVLFTDLVGFTTLAEDRDPEAVRELLTRYFDSATEIINLHGGTIEKFIGDAVMAVWGTPVAHEDDAERAVRAALELVSHVATLNPELRARAGVLTGEAAVTLGATNQGMVAGDLVNTAARLQGVADAGTVLVGETTRHAAESAIVFEPIGDHSLKGKTSPVPAWQALRVVAQRGGHGRADTLEPPFVGREEELRQLKEVLHAVGRERKPRLVSITGPGGIGKSRLVWELEKYIDGVAEKIWWHRGRSPSYGEGITFWALGEMVRRRAKLSEDDDEATTRQRIAATLEEHVADASERERIGAALLTLLGVEEAPPGGRDALFPAWRLFFERIAERGTTVLVFEDLQWADTGLLDFIDHVLDWSRGLPIMVVTLARPELFDRRPDWGAGRRQLTALALEPLADDEIRQLLEGLVPGLPTDALAAIVGRAEGIPLYAVETVRGLLADGRIERRDEVYVPTGDLSQLRVPESLRSLIASRLDALEPADRQLLQDASVLGQVFSAESLTSTTGIEPAELATRLRDLVRRELLDIERDAASPEVGQYKFVQSLIREVAYGTLARRDRRSRHLAVARHYEAVGDDELAGALAGHYVAAHEASEAGAEADAIATQARLALSAAADRAAALGSPEQAVRYLEQSVALSMDPAEKAGLLVRAASAAAAAAVDAVPFATAAVDTYSDLGERASVARARVLLGRIHLGASEMGRAAEVLEDAIREARSVEAPEVLAAALANLARAHMRSGAPERAIEAAEEALPIAERLNLDEVAAEAFINKGASLNVLGRRREGSALLRAALEIIQRIGARAMEMRARNNLASAMSDDDPAGSNRVGVEALALARQLGDRGMYNWLLGNASLGAFAEGREWDKYMNLLEEALDVATLRRDRQRLRVIRGLFETARGQDLDRVRAEVRELVGDSQEPEHLFVLHMTFAGTALVAGDADTAWTEAMQAAALNTQNAEVPLAAGLGAAAWSRHSQRIREVVERIAALPASGAYTEAFRKQAEGAVAAVEGRTAEAVARFGEAIRTMNSLEQRFDAALAVLMALNLLPGEGEVRGWALQARSLMEELRAKPYVQRLDELLAEAGAAASSAATVSTRSTAR